MGIKSIAIFTLVVWSLTGTPYTLTMYGCVCAFVTFVHVGVYLWMALYVGVCVWVCRCVRTDWMRGEWFSRVPARTLPHKHSRATPQTRIYYSSFSSEQIYSEQQNNATGAVSSLSRSPMKKPRTKNTGSNFRKVHCFTSFFLMWCTVKLSLLSFLWESSNSSFCTSSLVFLNLETKFGDEEYRRG